jgi:RNA ligase (TIGR02306 family)
MRFNCFRQFIYKRDHRGAKGFPDFISKTDESRVQSIPYILSTKQPWIATEKIDGCSSTFALKKHKSWYGKTKYEFIVCSRNLRLFADDDSHYWKIAKSKNLEKILLSLIEDNEWVAIQGEICGPGIQKNKYQLKDFDFYAFNLIYPHGRAGSLVANSILANVGLKFVPIIDTEYILPDTVQEVLDYAHGRSALNEHVWREGLVFRSQDGKQSFKAVDPLFLLKYDE